MCTLDGALSVIKDEKMYWSMNLQHNFFTVQKLDITGIIFYLFLGNILRYLFQVVQTQTTTAYCRILPTLDHHV